MGTYKVREAEKKGRATRKTIWLKLEKKIQEKKWPLSRGGGVKELFLWLPLPELRYSLFFRPGTCPSWTASSPMEFRQWDIIDYIQCTAGIYIMQIQW